MAQQALVPPTAEDRPTIGTSARPRRYPGDGGRVALMRYCRRDDVEISRIHSHDKSILCADRSEGRWRRTAPNFAGGGQPCLGALDASRSASRGVH
eukprot:CAMPEP_0115831840 /NCGR_PEP_ID=MMETSP0287-20121206/2346_1 /TAXON_ID=412157 /ORGANISM="Chrysochromulina rotalis, Strain UIO044" /LENGTH=95 /DNA_ID=CAMNT_0003285199 /DNA_START=354 /DNA_END=641 /DNA_ORIENTATION=+